MKKIIAIFLITVILILSGCNNISTDMKALNTDPLKDNTIKDNSNFNNESDTSENTEETAETEPVDVVLNNYIDNAVNKYNAQATEQLVFFENFTPSDKESGHYRVEFRLSAYNDAVGKAYLIGDKLVDIVASQTYFGEINCRVYTNNASFDQIIALIRGFSPILDEALTDSELQETMNEISTKKRVNGYYFGELGITLSGSNENGYELMLKTD